MRVFFGGVQDAATAVAPGKVRRVPVALFVGRYPSGGQPFRGWLAELRLSANVRSDTAPPKAPLEPDKSTVLLFQPGREGRSVANRGSLPVTFRLVNVKTRGPGPVPGLTGIRLGERGER